MAIERLPHLPEPQKLDTWEELRSYLRRLLDTLKTVRRGKLECVIEVTLTANVASTTVTDRRISPQTFIGFEPKTANAAAEIGAGTMYITTANRGQGTATITHANNAQTDRTFHVALIG